ncbi:hypothetical protein DL96DRAFT_1705831 [Flagelloscypha sp. PMI_526]|nr:hypothetical protein DL96DRAFT_1705831 [Flagelloscypha sp. PMI_526]
MAAFTLTRPSTGTVSPDVKRVDGEGFDFPTFSLVNKQSRVSVSPNPLPINNALTYSLFSISNVLGCFSAAIVTTSGPAIVLSSLSDLRKAVREATSPYEAKCTIHLQERAQHLAFTSTGARLFVGLESGAVLVFDVAKALADGHAEPLRSIPGPPLRSIVPNPNQESGTCDLVAFTRRDDGTAVVLDGQFQSQALFHPSDNACAVSSVSWSPKGKQLAVATRTAGIFTFTLPNPSKYQQYIPPTSPQVLATLNWLSPGHTFRVTYSPERDGSGDQLGDPVQQVLYWDSKTSKLTLYETMHPYANHDRPLQNSYYAGLPYYDEAEKGIEVLGKRFLMVVADPSSIDLEILATDSVRWYQASQENQLSLPLAQTGNDDDDDAGDSIPLFLGMDLTDADGGVPAWSVRPSRPYIGIVKPNAITSTSTSTLAPPPPLATAMSTTADPAPASSPPPPLHLAALVPSEVKQALDNLHLAPVDLVSPTNSSASTTAFSQITPTPSTSVFGQSSFGQSPSSFGQSTFGQPSSFGQAKQSPFGSSTGNVSGGFGAFANSSSGGFGSSAPQTQTGFGGSGAFGATSSTPAGFGGSAFGSGSNPQTSAFGSSSPVPASQEQGMDTAESVPDSEDEGGGGFGGLSLGKQPGSDANTRPGIFGVPATPAAQPSQSAFGGGGSASVIRSGSGAFGGVGMSGGAFGGSSISSSGGAFSGGSGTAWGSAATTSPTSGSGFGQSSFGSKPAFGQPAFGQSGFGAKPAITPSISSTSISGGGFSSFASQNPPEMKRGAPLTGGFAGFASGTSAFGSPAVKPALATVDKLDETMASVSASASPFGSSSPAGTSSPDGPFGSSSNVSPFKQPSPPSLSSDAQPKSTESPSTADSGAQNTTTDESSPASSLSFGKTTGERMFGGDASSISTPTGKEEATATISEPVATVEVKEEEKSPDLKTSQPAVLATPENKSIFGAGQTPPPSSIFGKSSTTPGGGSFFGKSFASPASAIWKPHLQLRQVVPSQLQQDQLALPLALPSGKIKMEDREDSPPPSSGQRKKHAILESPTSSPEATPKVEAASLPSSKTATVLLFAACSLASVNSLQSTWVGVSLHEPSGYTREKGGSGFKSVFSAPKPGASPLPTPASPPSGGFGSFSQKSAFGDVSASKTSFADLLQKDVKDGKRVPVFSPPEKVKEEPKEEVLPKEEPTTPPLPDEPAEPGKEAFMHQESSHGLFSSPGSTSSSFVDCYSRGSAE